MDATFFETPAAFSRMATLIADSAANRTIRELMRPGKAQKPSDMPDDSTS